MAVKSIAEDPVTQGWTSQLLTGNQLLVKKKKKSYCLTGWRVVVGGSLLSLDDTDCKEVIWYCTKMLLVIDLVTIRLLQVTQVSMDNNFTATNHKLLAKW